ncbi:MAG TPA: hypothetical protein VFY45_03665 [Baekduia sp.]|nr:hypothetical protein [Baekduia sp.]
MSVSTQYGIQGDTPLQKIAGGVAEAQEALLEAVRSDQDREWRMRDLVSSTKNRWTNSEMTIAFWDLVEREALLVDERLVVHLGPNA